MPALSLGDEIPNFYLDRDEHNINLHDFIAGSWAILFSYPRSFTPICTTELGRAAQLAPEFAKRGVKMLALSCDAGDINKDWIEDVKTNAGITGEFPVRMVADKDRQIAKICPSKLTYVNKDSTVLDVKTNAGITGEFPVRMVADKDRQIAKTLGLIDPDLSDDITMPITCRAVFIIGPDKKLRLSTVYPTSCGHNFDEILRSIDSLFVIEEKQVGTPVDWLPGDDVMVVPSIRKKEESTLFPKGVTRIPLPSGKDYMRITSL